MDFSVLSVIAGSGAVATAVALSYLLLANIFALLGRFQTHRRRRGQAPRPGEVVRLALESTEGRLHRHATASLLFAVSFGLLVLLGDRSWLPDQSTRVWVVVLLALLVPQVYGLFKFVQLARYRQRLSSLLHLQEEMASRLVEAQLRGNRIHYAVATGGVYIDAVVTGTNGVYALRLVAPPAGSNAVQLRSGRLGFQPSQQALPMTSFMNAIGDLQREIGMATGVGVLVQPVIIAPGCRVNLGDDDSALVVNLDSCVSFVGWKNPKAFIMEEEVRLIDEWLAGHAAKPNRAARQVAAATLGNSVPRPVLV